MLLGGIVVALLKFLVSSVITCIVPEGRAVNILIQT
jgi:hypothetical protein